TYSTSILPHSLSLVTLHSLPTRRSSDLKELTYLMKISVNLIISFLLLLNKGKLFLTFIKRKILNALNLHSTTTLTKINYQQEILTYLEELDFQKENLKKLLQKIILFAKAELMKILKNIY